MPKTHEHSPATGGDNDDRLEQLVYQGNTKVEERKRTNKSKGQQVSYFKILLTYADGVDKFLMCMGYFMAIATGVGLPSFVFLFGNIVDEFGKGKDIV